MKIPVAQKFQMSHVKHGHHRNDPYNWMKNRDSEEVLAYIDQENKFADYYFENQKNKIDSYLLTFNELLNLNRWGYVFEKSFKQYCWKEDETLDYRQLYQIDNDIKTLVLDENKRAENQRYYQLSEWTYSPNSDYLLLSEDFIGRRNYEISLIHLKNQSEQKLHLKTDGNLIWHKDSKSFFYIIKDEETLREYKVMQHVIGQPIENDLCLFEEKDERFYTSIECSIDNNYLIIESQSSTSNELLIYSFETNSLIKKLDRKEAVLTSILICENTVLLCTNEGNPNRKLILYDGFVLDSGKELMNFEDGTYIEDVVLNENGIGVLCRKLGQYSIQLFTIQSDQFKELPIENELGEITFLNNNNPKVNGLYYSLSALNQPYTIYFYSFETNKNSIHYTYQLKRSFDSSDYSVERKWFTSHDGLEIPVSLVFKNGIDRKNAPLLLYGYGSYGITIPTSFNPYLIPLLDEGFTYAIAHIRGGKFLGEHWYQDAKWLKKKNTFLDFISVAEQLIARNLCHPSKLFAQGGSAGGLLMGAVINSAPHLFKGIIADVPFVDVVTTMLDSSLPLTVGEYEEWGNPEDEKYYWYMLSYSPYDNIRPNKFPSIYITSGYHDSQVQYWEPLKWGAKLRDNQEGPGLILHSCELDAGHGGGSGREKYHLELAKNYTFLTQLCID